MDKTTAFNGPIRIPGMPHILPAAHGLGPFPVTPIPLVPHGDGLPRTSLKEHLEADDPHGTLAAAMERLYEKPDGGIPEADLSESVRSSLGKAEPNVIEKIKVNDEEMTVGDDKSVNIPVPDAYTKDESDAMYVPSTTDVLTDQWDVIPPDGHDVSEYETPWIKWGDSYQTGTESWEYSPGFATPGTVSYDRDERGPIDVLLEVKGSFGDELVDGQIVRRVVRMGVFDLISEMIAEATGYAVTALEGAL